MICTMKNANLCKVCLLPYGLAELFDEVIQKGYITLADRYGLMAALLSNSLSEEENDSINRLLHFVRRGRLKVVDEL